MFRILPVLAALALVAQTEFQDEAEYREEMRKIEHAFTALSEYRGVRMGPELEREAARLEELFTDVERFWKARGNEEAASFAGMAKDGAEEARTAARDGDDKSFDAALDTVAASCEGCHKEPLDKYRFRLPE